jgi:ABC-type lipoprotein export system ATPase subunit
MSEKAMKLRPYSEKIYFIMQNYELFERASAGRVLKVAKKIKGRRQKDIQHIVEQDDIKWFLVVKRIVDLYKGTKITGKILKEAET